MYIILKYVKNAKGKEMPVIILDPRTQEIWEFDNIEEATKIKEIFEVNSNNGYRYQVKKII
jgi:hypothetical protein